MIRKHQSIGTNTEMINVIELLVKNIKSYNYIVYVLKGYKILRVLRRDVEAIRNTQIEFLR